MNTTLHAFTAEPMIAYFSMEIGVKNDIPTYSGGLGILAGDTSNQQRTSTCPWWP